jgi:hypothetical protein
MVNEAAVGGRILPALLPTPIGPIWTDERYEMPAIASSSLASRPLLLVALIVGAVLAATLGLWAYYGTAVFFEMVRTGWAACF